MLTVLLSIFAHGLSAVPGMKIYARQLAALAEDAPEKQAVGSELANGRS
jgi:hypothetical protein